MSLSPLFFAVTAFASVKLAVSPHDAALRIMNTFYQTCEATRKAPYDVENHGEMRGYSRVKNEITHGSNSKVEDLALAKKSQYYISCDPVSKPAKDCRDLCSTPPTYIWGGMGVYTKTAKGIEINVFENAEHTQKNSNHPGLDCSGYMYAAFATAGLRVHPDMSPSAETADTLTARSYLKQEGGCFNDVSLVKKKSLRPGDLIAWKTHMAMIDTAGDDPFGLKKIKSIKDCTFEKLNPDAFEIVLLNSKGGTDAISDDVKSTDEGNTVLKRKLSALDGKTTGVGIGISKLKLSDLAVVAPKAIMELALAACYGKFGKDLPAEKALNQKPWRETINVVRHRLTEPGVLIHKDDKCLARADETVSLTGFDCVKSCSK